MTPFRDNEKHLSQIPALHLLQAVGYRMLTKGTKSPPCRPQVPETEAVP